MTQRKQGRGWGELKADTPEGRELAQFLRDLITQSGRQIRDLEKPTMLSRTSIGQHLSGEKLPSAQFLDRFVSATTPPREKALRLQQATRLLEKAKNPAPPLPVPSQATGGTVSSLVTLAATAQGQAAQAQEELRRAHQRNGELTRERDDSQRMVLSLSLLTSDLRRKIATVEHEMGDQARGELKKLTAQLASAQAELDRARAGRDESELLVQRLRRRSDLLEEQLAQARDTKTVSMLFSDSVAGTSSPRPEEVQEAAFQTDFARALRTAQGFLDDGQAHRDLVREEWSLASRRTTVGPVEQWRTATYVATRSLGCLLVAVAALGWVSLEHPTLAVLLILAGLLLVADPWEPLAKLWKFVRSLIRQEQPGETLAISSRALALRGGRCLGALLTATGVALSAQAAGTWWLVLLVPLTCTVAAYTVVGQDDRVRAAVQQAIGDLAADFSAAPPRPGRTAPTQLIALSDPGWAQDRKQELSTALAQGWGAAVVWVKVLFVLPLGLFTVALMGSFGAGIQHAIEGATWDSHGMVAVVDAPVRAYLETHRTGLPVTADTLYTTWLAVGAGLLTISFVTCTFGARLTWAGWGACSVAMVWAATTGPARGIACAVTGLAWGIASIFALRGVGTRRR
ncbi:coiled-coil domain-containing protein [Streptomyces arboris]|uniref:Uncharacterized protein n=1 Tax=Streptomyces arboris TaxID=2600619 RepID=A0A5N5EBM8_9ACTN|nr:hypothetical protein [Streptomyces arboris]KAB2587627.1 hypothetical protein F5983_36905 [Streptomyces arboris]